MQQAGRLVSVGDGNGSTTVIKLQHSLARSVKGERTSANDMFERFNNDNDDDNDNDFVQLQSRETRRERILENRKKTLKVKEKQLKMMGS